MRWNEHDPPAKEDTEASCPKKRESGRKALASAWLLAAADVIVRVDECDKQRALAPYIEPFVGMENIVSPHKSENMRENRDPCRVRRQPHPCGEVVANRELD